MTAAPGPWRAAALLARLRLTRFANRFRSAARYRMGAPDRKAASRVSPGRSAFVGAVLLAMYASFAILSWQSITNIEERPVASAGHGAAAAPPPALRPAAPRERAAATVASARVAPGHVLEARVIAAVTIEATLVVLAALLGAIASRDLVRPDWDLEWLVTLPLPRATLIGALIVERAIAGSFGFIFLAAFLSALAVKCGYGLAAPAVGVALTVPLMFLTAIVQIVADTGLRLVLAPVRLRNLQAVSSLLVSLPVIAVLSLASPRNLFLLDWFPLSPDLLRWLPGGLLASAVTADTGWHALGPLAILIAEVALAVAAGAAVTARLMRDGVVAAGVREGTARRPRGNPRDAKPRDLKPRTTPGAGAALARLLSPVQRRDLQLLLRDRTLLVQTLVLPVMTVGLQVVTRGGDPFVHGLAPTPALAALAFYLAAFTLMQPSFRSMASEGPALWVLYALPHALEKIVLHKAALWAAVAGVYPLVIFGAVLATAGAIPLEFAVSIPIVLLGVPIFAVIGTALGVFAFDPLALDEHRRIRLNHLYLYMMLGSFYAYAIFAPGIWQRAALAILTALVAVALWQRARDHFEYLLDPAAAPPAQVSVSDGLIAALAFFVLQAGITLFVTEGLQLALSGRILWVAFTVAGGVTYAVVRLIYWRARTAGVPVLLPAAKDRKKGLKKRAAGVLAAVTPSLAWGLAGGAVAALGGILYLQAITALGLMPAVDVRDTIADPELPVWLAALAVVAAPVFEEFIFRGLIFTGLRRSLGTPAAALASAAIFGLVHPPLAALPVAVMGLCAALAYARTGALLAAMLVHACYNAATLALQWHAVLEAAGLRS